MSQLGALTESGGATTAGGGVYSPIPAPIGPRPGYILSSLLRLVPAPGEVFASASVVGGARERVRRADDASAG
eukprot:5102658-Pyramimonas_sp.AAC.1